ncbi:MAG: Gfo/Idh/MocA family oxidoreductase [Bacteroidales bacterium]|nr:Gfo/Idh/MocA family oxidoreductase [Bacteroidales bacterium]
MNEGRRSFLKKSAVGIAAATILPRNVFGKMGGDNNFTAPSDQLTRGIIGVGGIGRSSYHYYNDNRCRLVAVCDVDSEHLRLGVEKCQQKYGDTPASYSDWRDLVADSNVDIVHICTPPHWHGVMACAAARAGKDIWCEKPMTRTIGESRRVAEVVKENGRIFRLNTWFRFADTFYGLGTEVEPLKKLVMSGLLGWPLTVRISGANGFAWKFFWQGKTNLAPEAVPANLDYDMWLGPAPLKPYNPHRVHQTFRGYWDYDGGGLADMGQHYIDPVQYILGKDDTFPVKVEADAPQQHPDAAGTWRSITYTYDDGCRIILEGEGHESEGKVPFIEGPLGKVYKGFECTIPNVMDIINELPDPPMRNTDFIECVLGRRRFALDENIGHHSSTIVNMGVCALRLGRTLHFDPKTELFIGDDSANHLIYQPMRGDWKL